MPPFSPLGLIVNANATLNQMIESLQRHYGKDDTIPVIIPLSGGTLNGAARAIGTGGQPEVMLR